MKNNDYRQKFDIEYPENSIVREKNAITYQKDSVDNVKCTIEYPNNSIGTLGEKTLHAIVKHYVEPDVTKHEIKVGAYYADIVTDSGIIEIHTGSFNTLRKKLVQFLKSSPVTIVYPLPKTKWLIWLDEKTGEVSKKRKSPKSGSIYDSINELYKIKPLLNHPNIRLRLLFVDIEEYRYLNGWSEDKKRGSTRCDRIPISVVEEVSVNTAYDYRRFIPDALPQQFTSMDYKNAAKINQRTSQTALNILNSIGVVNRIGKQGRLYIYERSRVAAE